MKKICVVTGTRAEYGLFYPILKAIEASETLTLQLVATTMHTAPQLGLTLRRIEEDGFRVDEIVENLLCADTPAAKAKSTGLATTMLADVFRRLAPDALLLLGDRFETLAAATAALLMDIPIAHIHGGETTEGAVDEQIRHAITKMSHLHFVAAEPFRRRLIRMGEAPERVHVTGAPGLDNIVSMTLPSLAELEESLGWRFKKPTALFTYHPVTLGKESGAHGIEAILAALQKRPLSVLFTYANADAGGHGINEAIERFARQNPERYKVVKSLGQRRYLAAMKYADLLIGNTSSGIIEAASFHKPVVNIGPRQQGRLRNANVIDTEIADLDEAIGRALDPEFVRRCRQIDNRYGDGDAARRIVSILEAWEPATLKRFYEGSA